MSNASVKISARLLRYPSPNREADDDDNEKRTDRLTSGVNIMCLLVACEGRSLFPKLPVI